MLFQKMKKERTTQLLVVVYSIAVENHKKRRSIIDYYKQMELGWYKR